MHVAFDATLDDEPTTGIGLVARQLALALESQVRLERWGASTSGDVPRHRRSRTGWTLGTLPALLQQRTPDVFHALSNFNLPFTHPGRGQLVLTVHDAVPVLLPATVSAAFRWQFRLWLARSLEVADQVVFVSEAARRDVLANFDCDVDKTSVVHHGVGHVHHPTDPTTEAWLDALGLPPRFVLYAGALDARKNVQLLLGALEGLLGQGQPIPLVLAGQRWFGAGVIEARLQRATEKGLKVRHLGYLRDGPFYALMRRATAFVFPSQYEGFGLPPLEAMALGVPTVVSDGGALPEVVGEGALVVPRDKPQALANALNQLWTDETSRLRLQTAGLQRAKQFTWANAARSYLDIYRKSVTP